MLPGVHFDIVEVDARDRDRRHNRTTDADGVIRICFPEPIRVEIREIPRASGGKWATTGAVPSLWTLGCAEVEVWIGNAEVSIPSTGHVDRWARLWSTLQLVCYLLQAGLRHATLLQ